MLLKALNHLFYRLCQLIATMRWIYIFILMIFSATTIQSQALFLRDNEYASEEIEMYCDSIVDVAMALMYSEPDSARHMLENTLDVVGEKAGPRQIRMYVAIGASYHIQADYGKALDYFFKAIILSTEMNDSIF